MLELIFKPLNYLSIRWDNGIINKTRFDFIIPLLIAFLISVIMTFLWFKIGTDKSNIFINDLSTVISHSSVLIYADDVKHFVIF